MGFIISLLKLGIFRPCLVRTFLSLSFHHSVFITHHPSPITHYSSLKISQFSLPCVWTLFSLQITQIFHHFFVGPPTDHQVSNSCCLPALIPNSFSSHFPFTPEYRVPLPKPKPEPFILALKLLRLASSVCTITISEAPSPRLASFSSFRFEQASLASKIGMLCC